MKDRTLARAVTAISAGFVIVAGDIAMIGVCGLCNSVVPGPFVTRWLVAATVVALGAYLLLGLPQVKVWKKVDLPRTSELSSFSRRSLEWLSRGGLIPFIAASVVGGPLAVGWYYGRTHHAKAKQRTLVASSLMALCWTGIYLGAWAGATSLYHAS